MIEMKTETVNVNPRMLQSSWGFESMENLQFVHNVSVADKSLKPVFKGKVKTVKQRNKLLSNHFIGSSNRDILNNRRIVELQKSIVKTTADEIRAKLDKEILENILKLYVSA